MYIEKVVRYVVLWVDNLSLSQTYGATRKMRKEYGLKTKSTCFVCDVEFLDEDYISIIGIENHPNKLAHRSCAAQIQAEMREEQDAPQ